MTLIKSSREIETMREAGQIVAGCLETVSASLKSGAIVLDLDSLAEEYIVSLGAKPAFKGYQGFPASICVSINEQVVHGIPGPRKLKEGDIVGLDVGVELKGYFADAAATYPVGKVGDEAQRLMEVTEGALQAGIDQCREMSHLSDVSHAIQRKAEDNGFSVVRKFVGHGIGRKMHESPQIPNFGPPGIGLVLKPGMVLAIEPMVNAGGSEVAVSSDGWTVTTADGSLSAHFEHTVAITAEEPLVLTGVH